MTAQDFHLEITCSLSMHTAILVLKERKALSESLSFNANPPPVLPRDAFLVPPGLGQHETAGQPYPAFLRLLAMFGPDRKDHEVLRYLLFATPKFLAVNLFSAPSIMPAFFKCESTPQVFRMPP